MAQYIAHVWQSLKSLGRALVGQGRSVSRPAFPGASANESIVKSSEETIAHFADLPPSLFDETCFPQGYREALDLLRISELDQLELKSLEGRREICELSVRIAVLRWIEHHSHHKVTEQISAIVNKEDTRRRRVTLRHFLLKQKLHELVVDYGKRMNGINKNSGLYPVANHDNSERVGDVVFVHGLEGHHVTTWCHDQSHVNYWPGWVASQLPNVGVWSLGYAASASAWSGTTLPLIERAKQAAWHLSAKDIGTRPLVFVTHSMGGLIVKQILRNCRDNEASTWANVGKKTKGIVFLGTPHLGSDVAKWVSYLRAVLRSSVSVDELKPHSEHLTNLDEWFRNNVHLNEVGIQAFYETEKTPVVGGVAIQIVDRPSADPKLSGVIPIPIEQDHLGICKPNSSADPLVTEVSKFIRVCLNLL